MFHNLFSFASCSVAIVRLFLIITSSRIMYAFMDDVLKSTQDILTGLLHT